MTLVAKSVGRKSRVMRVVERSRLPIVFAHVKRAESERARR